LIVHGLLISYFEEVVKSYLGPVQDGPNRISNGNEVNVESVPKFFRKPSSGLQRLANFGLKESDVGTCIVHDNELLSNNVFHGLLISYFEEVVNN
jgi:hypothetical protein